MQIVRVFAIQSSGAVHHPSAKTSFSWNKFPDPTGEQYPSIDWVASNGRARISDEDRMRGGTGFVLVEYTTPPSSTYVIAYCIKTALGRDESSCHFLLPHIRNAYRDGR